MLSDRACQTRPTAAFWPSPYLHYHFPLYYLSGHSRYRHLQWSARLFSGFLIQRLRFVCDCISVRLHFVPLGSATYFVIYSLNLLFRSCWLSRQFRYCLCRQAALHSGTYKAFRQIIESKVRIVLRTVRYLAFAFLTYSLLRLSASQRPKEVYYYAFAK